MNALFALPFWPWGAAAAFNGAALLGVAGSGWCCYALARGVGLERGAAFVAGAVFLLWPIHLIALTGHLEKLFVGMLPLTLLAGAAIALDSVPQDISMLRSFLALVGTAITGLFVVALLGAGPHTVAASGHRAIGVAPVAVDRVSVVAGLPGR